MKIAINRQGNTCIDQINKTINKEKNKGQKIYKYNQGSQKQQQEINWERLEIIIENPYVSNKFQNFQKQINLFETKDFRKMRKQFSKYQRIQQIIKDQYILQSLKQIIKTSLQLRYKWKNQSQKIIQVMPSEKEQKKPILSNFQQIINWDINKIIMAMKRINHGKAIALDGINDELFRLHKNCYDKISGNPSILFIMFQENKNSNLANRKQILVQIKYSKTLPRIVFFSKNPIKIPSLNEIRQLVSSPSGKIPLIAYYRQTEKLVHRYCKILNSKNSK